MNAISEPPNMQVEVFAPGRVNLIGEHTDYNGGMVLPFALDRGITMRARWVKPSRKAQARETPFAPLVIESLPQATQLLRSHLSGSQFQNLLAEARYQNLALLAGQGRTPEATLLKGSLPYIAGACTLFHARGNFLASALAQKWEQSLVGMDLTISSNLPTGAGLSSSAALTTGFLCLLQSQLCGQHSLLELCEMAMEVEHYYAGTKCGLMDQLAVAFCEQDNFLQVHFDSAAQAPSLKVKRTLVQAHPIFNSYVALIFHTGVTHSLASSEYNLRRQQCANALEKLNSLSGVNANTLGEYFFHHWQKLMEHLCLQDLNLNTVPPCVAQRRLIAALHKILDETNAKRAGHAIFENFRVREATKALSEGNCAQLSNLMQSSHASLKNDYEVSCHELDTACELLREASFALQKAHTTNGLPPLLGPRMTGGGFGGSVVALVHENLVNPVMQFFNSSENPYTKVTGKTPRILLAKPSPGIRLRYL